jgi:predicted alpha/beta-hydrolase family hydrolase
MYPIGAVAITGARHNGAVKKKWGLVLAPGASADSTQPALVAIENAVPDGFAVHRMDFPYRLAGKRAPDRQPVLVEAVREAVAAFARRSRIRRDHIFVGGRSMGGRMCSLAVAEGMPAAGLVLVSYPLHPPGKPDKLRVEHFPAIDQPCLFISGTRDAFGSPAELRKHIKALPGSTQMQWIEGGDHGLRRRDDEVAQLVRGWLETQAGGV